MTKKSEKILTPNRVKKLGLDKVSVITSDMLDEYTSIGSYAFINCRDLISVTIPNSITFIGCAAFAGCSSLTSITIPNSVTSIGAWAFYNCSALTSIDIPNNVTSIEESAFDGCRDLISVTIPNSVTCIWRAAFYGCRSLKSVKIPNSITLIGDEAFAKCTSLTSITIGDKTYKPKTVTNGKCKAYKGFSADMTCRDFKYKEGETYEYEGEPILCCCGFHACLNLSDVFTYYCGEFGKDIIVYEVKLEGVSDKRYNDSKVVAKKITIGKRIL